MKNEPRILQLSTGVTITLPLGLTYDQGEVGLCTHCGGVVKENEPLIRRGKYRNRAFEQEFPSRNGFCLACTKTAMTQVIARWFSGAQQAIRDHGTLEQQVERDEATELKLDAYEQAVEMMQLFITQLSTIVGEADKHETEYAYEPVPEPEFVPDPVPDIESA